MKKLLAIIGVLLLLINMVSLPASAAEQTPLERVKELIDSLPETYQVGNGDVINEIAELIEENSFTKNDVGTAKYSKFILKHKNQHNSWLGKTNYQDRVKIDWAEKNPLTCVDLFEYAKYDKDNKNIAIPVEEIAKKPGIVMASNNTKWLPENLTSGNYIGFYETQSVKDKYSSTFPSSYGEYYITESGVQFEYSGISQKTGDITYNGGMVTTDYSYDIPFDGYTKYSSVSFLVSGITYLSGEYARQLSPTVTKVYYADGSYEENFHISGLFCYSYRMALYSMLEGKAYSEFLGTATVAKQFDQLWYPQEANVASFFKIGNGLGSRDNYKINKTIGNATVITINTKNKAVDRVEVSYATVNQIKANGGIEIKEYTTREEKPVTKTTSNTYLMPVDEEQLKGVEGYEEERDYYIGVIRNAAYPLYLHGVTGTKTEGVSYKDEIADIEEKIDSFPDEFTSEIFEELNEVNKRYEFLLKQGVSSKDFDKNAVEKLKRLLEYNITNGEYYVYVSPNGNDNGSGSSSDPLRTLEGAKKFVRGIKKDKPVNVIFQEGEYNFDETVEFNSDDSGVEGMPVTYKAQGEVVFTTKDTVKASDFTLVKEGENSKISPELIGKIYKIDLNKHNIYPGAMPAYESTGILGDGYDDVAFFVNNKEQMVAQWPNGEGNYDVWVELASNKKAAGIIRADAERSKRWQGEKFSYFEGYPSPDYSNERNNLTIEGDLLKFNNGSRFELDEKHSRRYKVKHILSELDVPGEWYLDRDTNIFYYYPTKDFTKDAEVSFASRKLNLIRMTRVKYVNFDGITFDKIRGDAFYAAYNLEELNIYNSSFTNISNNAIKYEATSRYDGHLTSVSNYIDAANNCEIRNNKFVNIGAAAIIFRGGDREHLTGGQNVIANNYIYSAGNKQRCTPVMQINGAYNYALNNEAHNLVFHALNHGGNENVVAYNEFYNALRDTGDCGVIYSGRQFATRGTEIAYNYVHHYSHLDKKTSDNGVGIYLDDRLSGIYVHHNILYPDGVETKGNGIQNGSGMHNIINYNIIVDADESMTRSNRFVEDYSSTADGRTVMTEAIRISGIQPGEKIIYDDGVERVLTASEAMGRYELYFEKYPELEETIETLVNPNESVPKFVEKYPFILTHANFVPTYNKDGSIKTEAKYGHLAKDLEEGNDLTKYRLLSMRAPMKNTYIGNVTNTPWRRTDAIDKIYTNFENVFENNPEDVSKDIFVDAENQDFRIKADLGFEGYIDETFDLDSIGIQPDGSVSYDFEVSDYQVENPKDLSAEEKSFNLTYPENNSKVNDVKNVQLMWERPTGSDYFILEIATDKEMKNIVYRNEEVKYNHETVTTLPTDVDTFYWRVTAKNIKRGVTGGWENADGVNVFHTYDASYIEGKGTVPFDISADFNLDVFNNEGETHNNSSKLGGKNETLGMYNLTNLKKLVNSDGIYKYGETVYSFPQVSYDTDSNNVVSTQVYANKNKNANYVYTLKEDEKDHYDCIRFAMSAGSAVKNYNIIVHYTDGSKDTGKVELCQYYTTYYNTPGYDIILTTHGVNYKGEPVQSSNRNKIYQVEVDTDVNKIVDKIEFCYKSGSIVNSTSNIEYIFAITGVKNNRYVEDLVEKTFVVNNYSGKDKKLVMIVRGTENGKQKFKTVKGEIKANKLYQTVTVQLPKEVFGWENRIVYTWTDGNLAPLTVKNTLFE